MRLLADGKVSSTQAQTAGGALTLHGNDILSPSKLTRHLERGLDGLGPRVPEEERVERWVRHEREQLLDETKVWLVEGNAALQRGDA